MPKKIVITGGPGSGKTTLINALIELGYECEPEISRQITLDARNAGVEYLYLEDPLYFSKLLLDGRLAQFKKVAENNHELVFFDRGLPDVLAYLKASQLEVPDEFWQIGVKNTYDSVFLLPPWKEIYIQDNERYEAYELAYELYEYLKLTYIELGYTIYEVPTGSISNRIDFIIKSLAQ